MLIGIDQAEARNDAADGATVFVVDDDAGVRAAIQGLLKSAGLRCESFQSGGRVFAEETEPTGPGCLVLDVSLPGVMAGVSARVGATRACKSRLSSSPVTEIFPDDGEGHEIGCVEFLTKPFMDKTLLDAIQQALERDRVTRQQRVKLPNCESATRR